MKKSPKPIFIILVAFANDLVVVPVLNKIDLPNADPDSVKNQLQQLFDISPDSVLCASAKLGIGIEEIFQEIVRRIPPPNRHGKLGTNLRFLLQVGNNFLEVNFYGSFVFPNFQLLACEEVFNILFCLL